MITVSTLRSVSRGRRREHQVQRLGRGDQQVGRVADQRAALVGRRVAGAHADRRLRGTARPSRSAARRDARRAAPAGSSRCRRPAPAAARCRGPGCGAALLGRRRGDQPVDAPEERGERLARPGRRQDQRVLARRDRRPALLLGRGRRGERRLEPRPHGLGEQVESSDQAELYGRPVTGSSRPPAHPRPPTASEA